MDSKYGYLSKKTNVKELNVEIQVKGRYPGYSLETAKRFDNKSIDYRKFRRRGLQYQTYITRFRESANDAITIPAIPAPIPTIPTR